MNTQDNTIFYLVFKVLTSEIKKGDIIFMNGYNRIMQSDSYLHKGIWSVDIDDNHIFGWESRDLLIEVKRSSK
jgi:hypothetical protein